MHRMSSYMRPGKQQCLMLASAATERPATRPSASINQPPAFHQVEPYSRMMQLDRLLLGFLQACCSLGYPLHLPRQTDRGTANTRAYNVAQKPLQFLGA